MDALLWVPGLLLLYAAGAGAIVEVGLAVRTRRPGALVGAGAAGAAWWILWRFLPAADGLRMFLAGAACCTILATDFAVRLRPRMSWREARSARDLRRQTVLHLVLLSLGVLFIAPFGWLVSTSLKEDEDMSRFPPVWIPRQQVQVRVGGKQYGLATAPYQGRTVTAAVIESRDNGTRLLSIVSPASLAGVTFEASGSDVRKVKHFAPLWKNYPDALKFLPDETLHGLVFLENTVLLCALTILGTLLSSSLVAYAFARLRWPGRDLLFVVLLATMMVPGAVTMMPVFLIFRWLGWIDTLRPLWFPAFFGAAFNIFLLRQFFMTIPNDLEEAARIDGCSYFGIYWRIMLPLIKPALAAITIMTFMAAWNNFMGPLIYVSSPDRMPLSYALQLFQTAHTNEPGMMMAASTMMMLPVLLLFFFTQRYFIEGVTLTGIKG